MNHKNLIDTLQTSSVYDFEKGVMVNYRVSLPKDIACKLPKMKESSFFSKQQPFQKSIISRLNDSNTVRSRKRLLKQSDNSNPPPPGYYEVNTSSQRKSLVNMSKQLETNRTLIRKRGHESQSQISNNDRTLQQKPDHSELSRMKLQYWIEKERNNLQEAQRFQRRIVKLENNANFNKLFELTALKLRHQSSKSYF